MPKIPVLEQQPADFGRRAGAADFGAAQGQALGGLGDALAQVGDASTRIYVAQQEAKVHRLESELQLAADRDEFELSNDTDFDTHEERFEKGRKTALDAARKQLPSGWQAELEERATEIGERGRLRVRANVMAKRVDQTRADTAAAIDNLADAFARAADPRDQADLRGRALAAADGALQSGAIDQAQHDAWVRGFDAKSLEALAQAGKNQHPQATLEALRQRRGAFANLDEGRRQELIEELDGEVKQRERLAKIEEGERRERARQAKQDAEDAAAQEGMRLSLDGKLTTDWLRQNLPRLSKTDARYFENAVKEQSVQRGIPDPAEWGRLNDLQFTDPKAFSGETIDPAKVGADEWQKLRQAQARAKAGDPSAAGDLRTSARERAELAKGLDDNERGELQRSYEAALVDFEKREKRSASLKDRESVMDAVEMSRYRRGGFFSSAFLQPQGNPIQIPGVDQADVDEAIRALERAGQRVTPDSIVAKLRELAQ